MENFFVNYAPEGKTTTLFQYRYLVLNESDRASIDFSNIEGYLGAYLIGVSENVLSNYSNSIYGDILRELLAGNHKLQLTNPRSEGGTYLRFRLEKDTANLFKKLILSTLVYDSEGLKCPEKEYIELTCNPKEKTATISGLNLYVPENNPYYKYAQNAAIHTSVETIGLCNYNTGNHIKNFYDLSNIGKWKPTASLDNEKKINDVSGIYMLFNENTNELYIGKAARLKERIEQHKKDVQDYMRDFTHYRYSVVSDEYFEFLFLIENAAIHDVAQILEMPNARIYRSPLIELSPDLRQCKISNKIEYQTKRQS